MPPYTVTIVIYCITVAIVLLVVVVDRYQPSYKRSRNSTRDWHSGSQSRPDRRDVDPAEKIHQKIDHLLRKYRWKPAQVS